MTTRIAVLLTCHNRREATLACLVTVRRQRLPSDVELQLVLVDDGSTDGTAEAVRSEHPAAIVLEGDGSLYWNGGMRRAMSRAGEMRPDYYLWLNDDTILFEDAVSRLLATYRDLRQRRGVLIGLAGAVRDPDSGALSYGGWRRSSWYNPLKVEIVRPASEAVQCDTFNGNCVLMHAEVVAELGNLDPAYTHVFGDYDYGFRLDEAGGEVWLAPGFFGECHREGGRRPWFDPDLSWRERLRELRDVKVEPLDERLVYARRHGGPFWILPWLAPYLRVTLNSLFPPFFRPPPGPGVEARGKASES